jgi:AraC family transcriptional regulator of adaptative response / DNA-3-methyladenine glycosylase II
VFPTAAALADAEPASLGMPESRRRALLSLAEALGRGPVRLAAGRNPDTVRDELVALPGIGPWTAEYVALRALHDADAFMPTDLGVKHALSRLGVDPRPARGQRIAERWRPYRAYAQMHLWASLGGTAG